MRIPFYLLTLIFCTSVFAQWKTDSSVLIKKHGQYQYIAPKVQVVEEKYDQYGMGTPSYSGFMFTQNCSQQNLQNFGAAFDANINILNAPIENLQCSSIETLEKTKRYSETLCKGLASCLKLKFLNNPLVNKQIISDAAENTAAEAIALIAKNRIDEMIKFEELRLFAEKKYGKEFMPENCRELKTFKFQKETPDSKCSTKTIDLGFTIGMSNCNMAQAGCNPDFSEYMKNLNTKNDKSHLSTYFDKKVENSVSTILTQEEVVSEKLATILVDSKHTPEEKVEEIFKLFTENFSTINPVYKDYLLSYTNSPKRKDALKKGIASYIKTNSSKTKAEMISSFEDLKKSETRSMLEDKCNKIEVNDMMTMNGLCSTVDDIISGGEVEVDDREFNRFIDKQILNNEKTADPLWDLAKNVSRCNTFTLVIERDGIETKIKNKLSGEFDLLSDIDGFYNFKVKKDEKVHKLIKRKTLVINDAGVPVKRDDNFASSMNSTSHQEKERDTILESRFTRNLPLNDTFKSLKASDTLPAQLIKEDSDKASALKEGPSQHTTQQNDQLAKSKELSQAYTFNQQLKANIPFPKTDFNNGIDQRNEIVEKNNTTVAQNGSNSEYSALINKIQTLESRLKKPVAAESSALAEDSRLGKELKTFQDELEEMKKQKNEIERRNAQSSGKTEIVNAPMANVSQSSDAMSVSADTGKSFVVPSDSHLASSAPASSSSQTNVTGETAAPVNRAAARSTESIESRSESPANSNNDLQILTSSSNAATHETIAEMIASGADQPFYIEEDGVIQQIIPELINGKVAVDDDGKPIYKKIAKGKSEELVKLNLNIKRTIAKANSPADVKRMDEVKESAQVRYLQMKESLKLP